MLSLLLMAFLNFPTESVLINPFQFRIQKVFAGLYETKDLKKKNSFWVNKIAQELF